MITGSTSSPESVATATYCALSVLSAERGLPDRGVGEMTCFAMVVAAAAWSVAAVLAVVSSVGAGPFHTIAPWLLIALSVGVTATLCLAIETSREKAMRYVHAELEGEVTERHLSII